ncbi:putative membrane-anchored protein [Nocardia sp. GAS34]
MFMFVLGNAVGQAANISLNRRLTRNGDSAQAQVAQAISEATEIAQGYPRLRRRIEKASAATEYNSAPDSTFEYGLAALLDGFAVRLTARETTSAG